MRSIRYVGFKDVGLCVYGVWVKRYGEKFIFIGVVSGWGLNEWCGGILSFEGCVSIMCYGWMVWGLLIIKWVVLIEI